MNRPLVFQTQRVYNSYETRLATPYSASILNTYYEPTMSTSHYANPDEIAIQNRYDTYVERIDGYTLEIKVNGESVKSCYFNSLVSDK